MITYHKTTYKGEEDELLKKEGDNTTTTAIRKDNKAWVKVDPDQIPAPREDVEDFSLFGWVDVDEEEATMILFSAIEPK